MKNIDEIYADAWMLVIPSREEGLPNVVVEALTYGVPCIGFEDCPGVNHLIKNDKTGFLVSRDEPGGLFAAMSRLSAPDTRTRLSADAVAFATFQLGIEFLGEKLATLGVQCAGRGRSGGPASYAGDRPAWQREWMAVAAVDLSDARLSPFLHPCGSEHPSWLPASSIS